MRKCISWATLALFAVVLGFWMTAAASAEIIQPASQDVTVRDRSIDGWDDMNFGGREYLQIKADSLESRRYHAFVQFDVSGFTEDVASAKFSALSYAYVSIANPNVTREVSLYKVTEAWDEFTITYNNQPSFDSTPVATTIVKATITQAEEAAGGVWHDWESAGLADLVEYWIDNPTLNYGMMVRFTEPDNTTGRPGHMYRSSDYTGDASERPKLEITPVPEPGCVVLLLCGVASLLLIARRRR